MTTPYSDARPVLLPHASPANLITKLLRIHRHPTTVIICCAKQDFVNSLVSEAQHDPDTADQILAKTLSNVATSRHLRIAFAPTVTHLRAYLAAVDSQLDAPPNPNQFAERLKRPPLLLAYGFVDVHRDGGEWSAQGTALSASLLIDAALRNGLRAAIAEPVEGSYDEVMPLLSGAVQKEDGSWSGRTATVKSTLSRWFTEDLNQYEAQEEEEATSHNES